MLVLPPALSQVLDAAQKAASGEGPLDAVQTALPAARRFVLNGNRLLDQLSPALLRTERIQELLGSAGREVEAQRRALDAVHTAVLESRTAGVQRAAEELRSASERLQEVLRNLQAEEAQVDPFSPYRDLDVLMKTARNVLEGEVPPTAVQQAFGGAGNVVGRLRAATRRFAALYDQPELPARAEAPLASLEAGMGAVAEFLRAGHRVPLEDALRLLGPASVEIHELMEAMEAAATAQRRHARHPLVEELVRARERAIPEDLVAELWAETARGLEADASRVQLLRQHPLRLLAGLEPERPGALVEQAREAVERFRSTSLAQADLVGLDSLLHGLRETLSEQVRRLEDATAPLRGAALVEDLQVLVGRALLGELPPSELKPVLDHFRALQSGLAGELQLSAGVMDPGEEGTLQNLLMRQAAGCERLSAWCDEANPAHLREGWAMLAESTPRLVELSQAMRDRLHAAMAPPAGTTCLRCGTSNPRDSRYCRSCSAVLPFSTQDTREYSDITGGGEAPAMAPAHVVRLEELVHHVETGAAGAEEVAAEADEQLARAQRVAQGFQQQVLPRAQQDATVREYARFFQEQMELYVDGLHTIRQFAEDGQPDHLYRGLEACRSAGAELMALRSNVEAAARS